MLTKKASNVLLKFDINLTLKVAYNGVDAVAMLAKGKWGGHILIAGLNYAQGSSREHAALAPKFLGQIAVIAKSYARIGWQNLINFGILPFVFANEKDYDEINIDDVLLIDGINETTLKENKLFFYNKKIKKNINVIHHLSDRQIEIILAEGMINYFKLKFSKKSKS